MKKNKKIEEIYFLIKDVLKVNVLTFAEKFSSYDMAQFQDILEDAQRFSDDQLLPAFQSAKEKHAVQFKLGHIKMPEEYKQAWENLRNSDWFSILASTPKNGKYIPDSIKLPLMEIFLSADLSLGLSAMQTTEGARILDQYGKSDSLEEYYKPLFSGAWTAAISSRNIQNLDKPEQIALTAQAQADHFTFSGKEKFILGGDQDLGENVLYIIPAKVKIDEKGAEKIGLFAIPKIYPGKTDKHNSVVIDQYYPGTGVSNLPMCDVSFGEIGDTKGHLITILEPESKVSSDIIAMQQAYSIIAASAVLELSQELMLDIIDDNTALPDTEDLKSRIDLPVNMESFLKLNALQKGLKGAAYGMMFYRDCQQHGAEVQQKNFENLFNLYRTVLKPYAVTAGTQVLNELLSLMGDAGSTNFFPVEQFLRDLIVVGNIGGNNITLNDSLVTKVLIENEAAVFKSFMSSIQDIDAQQYKTDPLKQAIMEWQDYLGGAFLLQDEVSKEENGNLGAIYANRINHFMGGLIISESLVRQGIAAEASLIDMGANLLHLKQESKRDETVKDLFERLLISEFFAGQILSQEEAVIRTIQKKSAGAIEDFFS